MKKWFAIALACLMCVMSACTPANNNSSQQDASKTEESKADSKAESSQAAESSAEESSAAEVVVMSYAEYAAASDDTPVVVEAYVQGKQAWYAEKSTATVYAADKDGGYLFYNMACTQEEYAKLTEGVKIRVTGFKSTWSGEPEVAEATFEIVEGADTYVAEPVDVTASWANEDELFEKVNQKVAYKGLTVVAANDEGAAFLYNYDGSGSRGSDLYFNVAIDNTVYSFTVESFLCDENSEVYQAVEDLKVGDVIDAVGFMYWYEGMNPHITSVEVVGSAAMSGRDFLAADIDTQVVVDTFVQAKQGWDSEKSAASLYTQNDEVGFFIYNCACSKEEYDMLTEGTMIRVYGYKGEWAGEVEIVDAKFVIIDGLTFVANPVDVTEYLATETLSDYMNLKVSFSHLKVETCAEGNDAAFMYNYDGSGSRGSDLYFRVSDEAGNIYSFTVESSLCGEDTDVYKAVEALEVGSYIDMEGYLYWYEGPNPHITSVVPSAE